MAATPERIGFITTDLRRAIEGPASAVVSKYGELARDTKEPVPTFFDSVEDAAIIAAERMTLLSADRRRFVMEVADNEIVLDLNYQQTIPSAAVIDRELKADFTGIIAEIEVDLSKGKSTVMVWG